jgi:hypothetical protein
LVTPPSPHSLSADLNRPRQGRKSSSSNHARGRLVSRGEVDRGVGSECSIGDSSDADVDADSLRKDSTDSNPNSLSGSMDADGGVRQLDTPEASVHRAPYSESSTRRQITQHVDVWEDNRKVHSPTTCSPLLIPHLTTDRIITPRA